MFHHLLQLYACNTFTYPIMKNFATWPDPPFPSDNNPPEVPETFTIFNLTYKICDNKPEIKYGTKDIEFDPEHILTYLTESSNLFKTTVKKISTGKDVTNESINLVTLHENINSYFNNCRVNEAKKIVESEKNKRRMQRRDIKSQIDKLVEYKVNK